MHIVVKREEVIVLVVCKSFAVVVVVSQRERITELIQPGCVVFADTGYINMDTSIQHKQGGRRTEWVRMNKG